MSPDSYRLPEGSSRAAQALRTVTSTIQHHDALMRQARALYRMSGAPLHEEPATMYWIDRYLHFYDSKPLYRLDANHVAAFLSFVATVATCEEAESALRFFHSRVLHRPLPDDLTYHLRETSTPERHKASATRSLWSLPA
ncbi:MAG: phage integrase N-terminal SAM-like domain-containing protein [Longimonas sp.]|uniref:phage integrase N-terminal SAM-like domain-containing protein n=1 Tax=Longimonas sp. TaxID=2039626 RepID=UPI003347AB2B